MKYILALCVIGLFGLAGCGDFLHDFYSPPEIVIEPNSAATAPGKTLRFSVTVTAAYQDPSNRAIWSVTGGGSGTTIDADGLLTVGPAETAQALLVTARSEEFSRPASASVAVSLKAGTADPPDPPDPPPPGNTIATRYNGTWLYQTLAAAIADAIEGTSDNPEVITILRNIDMDAETIAAIAAAWPSGTGKHIKLTVPAGASKTLKRAEANTGAFFTVPSGSSLTLSGNGAGQLILDGGAVWTGGIAPADIPAGMTEAECAASPAFGAANTGVIAANGPLVQVSGGALTMNAGTVLRNNDRTSGTNGSGVLVGSGSFTMAGGRIINNKTTVNIHGAGVTISANAAFTLADGNISGNLGGGVSNTGGTFAMQEGGIISGNKAASAGGLGQSGGSSVMSGGEISDNTATGGGGGVVIDNGTFEMQTGKISNNTAGAAGGGVFLWDVGNPTFIMTDGEISDNHAGGNLGGGGVFIDNSSTGTACFYMQGGEIKDNILNGNGYGKGVYNKNVFTMSGTAVVNANNDVYLATSTRTITITDNLTGAYPVATITPQTTTPTTQVLGGTAELIADNCDKFALNEAIPALVGRTINNTGRISP